MQDRASEYPRDGASTLPRRPLAPTQRRISPPDTGTAQRDESGMPTPRLRADSAARALTTYTGASPLGAPTMIMPGTTNSGGMGHATVAPGLGARAVPYLPPAVALTQEPEVWLIALAT